MKIFVTVGTTRFDSLIAHVAQDAFFRSQETVLQVGPGGLQPEGMESFEYTDRIAEYYAMADVVVTHAGAGSIYQLLGLGKSIVIVPNTDRLDTHQSDIANFMHANGHALSVMDLNELVAAVQNAADTAFRPFRREAFFAAEEILDFLDLPRLSFR